MEAPVQFTEPSIVIGAASPAQHTGRSGTICRMAIPPLLDDGVACAPRTSRSAGSFLSVLNYTQFEVIRAVMLEDSPRNHNLR